MSEFATHGGDLRAAQARFPDAPRPWLDLSTGINPVAYPVTAAAPADWQRLPDAGALARLEQVAARRYGAPTGTCVTAAPGTQAIIQRLPALVQGRDIRILGPTYGEFERVFRGDDLRVEVVPTPEALVGADAAVVVNPNNPDGRVIAPDALTGLAARVGMLIVDEAFADALPRAGSVIPRLRNVVVLRSFGKMYGLAGLRLGFAICDPERSDALRRMLGPWPVSGPAITIGTRALEDETWLAAAAKRLDADGARLDRVLAAIEAKPVGGTPLFRLVEHPAAASLFRALAQCGILTRPFARHPDWLRFGLPGSDHEWDRLGSALATIHRDGLGQR